ncbi:hypothetical protein AK830_g11141 [Neonectria ditissima]|uniref:DUF676 domain-containing protein n=1 Tax=Neonectria ditissima TaxID=78410 RepID=A0A0P7B8V6_9HYPO|nr:hypothetical protein AK830_g11141 [Neonectria ditissima]
MSSPSTPAAVGMDSRGRREDSRPNENEKAEDQRLVEKSTRLADESKKDSELPHVDVVHVTMMRPNEGMHNLDDLLTDVDVTDIRELIFRCDMSRILKGEFTMKAIEGMAERLLHELLAKQKDISNPKKSIIFIAYDLGSLIVKMALFLASRSDDSYPGPFFNTIQISLASKLSQFLAEESDHSRAFHAAVTSIVDLSRSILHTNELFISSKITLRSQITSALEPLFDAPVWKEWDMCTDSEIMYIHGTSYSTSHELANNYFFDWQSKQRLQGSRILRSFSFTFSSTDPSRDSIPSMMAPLVIQIALSGGWTDKSCLSVFECMRGAFWGLDVTKPTLILLHDFDECRPESRSRFLAYYANLSKKTELQFKLLLTSKRPNTLLPELEQWMKLSTDNKGHSLIDPRSKSSIEDLVRFCTMQDATDKIQELIDGLAPMDPACFHKILQILEDHTGWPGEMSFPCLSHFVRLLELVDPADTAERVLEKILNSHANSTELYWTLNWLLCGHRPISPQVLAAILLQYRYQQQDEENTFIVATLFQGPEEATESQLRLWLKGLVDFTYDKVIIRRNICDLLRDDSETEKFAWNLVRRSAHQMIVEFCLAHLSQDSTIATLKSLGYPLQSRPMRISYLQLSKLEMKNTALQAVQSITSHLNWDHDKYQWPSSVIRAAIWLNMDKVAEELLGSGASIDPQDDITASSVESHSFFRPLLYMASILGHTETVQNLIRHGAKLDVLWRNTLGPMSAAAARGHADVLRAFVAQDPSSLFARQPNTALYAASYRGNRESVKVLLELEADPNGPQGGTDEKSTVIPSDMAGGAWHAFWDR